MRTSLFVAALLVAVPIASVAQPADKTKAAKEYVDAGQAAQNGGDYDTAIQLYSKAYELVPHPLMLFNMAQAHRLAGRSAEALDLYRRYVEADPKGSKVKTAREFITALEQRVRAEEAQKADEAKRAQAAEDAARASETPAEPPPDTKPQPVVGVGAGVEPTPPAAPDEPANGGGGGGGLRIGGMVAGGLGVASLGAGVFFGLQAKSIANELSEPGAPFTHARDDEGHAANQKMIIATAAGGALLVGGAVLYFLGRRQLEVAPVVTPDGGGISLRGGF
jgi:tetratricopeptide (TPR) repeat protein